jgi:hypothetical protein
MVPAILTIGRSSYFGAGASATVPCETIQVPSHKARPPKIAILVLLLTLVIAGVLFERVR